MKRTTYRWAAALLTLCLLLTGCGAGGAEPVKPETDGPFSVWDSGGVKLALPTESLDTLEVEIGPEKHVLARVWETASREAARLDELEKEKGLLLELFRCEALEIGDYEDAEFLAADGKGRQYGVKLFPEDQLYRSGGVSERDRAEWQRGQLAAALAAADFHWRNPDLTALTAVDLPETLAALEPGQISGTDPIFSGDQLEEMTGLLQKGEPVLNRPDVAFAPILGSQPAWHAEFRLSASDTLRLSCSLETEPLVSVLLRSGSATDAFCLEDQALYDLVRSARDGIREIDQEAYTANRELLDQAATALLEGYTENFGSFTACNLMRLTHSVTHQESPETRVEVYDVDFALVPEDPGAVVLADGLYLDSGLNLCGVNLYGQLAVRFRDGQQTAAAFVGEERQITGESTDADWDAVTYVLDQEEYIPVNPLHAIYEQDAPPELLAACDSFVDADGEFFARVVFRPDHEVRDFRYFEVEAVDQETEFTLKEGRTLRTKDRLSPDAPLLIQLELPETLPYRGLAFRDGLREHRYTISLSGEDGALLLIPMDD